MTKKEWEVRKDVIRGVFLRLMVDMECALRWSAKGAKIEAIGRLWGLMESFQAVLSENSVDHPSLGNTWDVLRDEDEIISAAFSRWATVQTIRTTSGELPQPLAHITRISTVWAPREDARMYDVVLDRVSGGTSSIDVEAVSEEHAKRLAASLMFSHGPFERDYYGTPKGTARAR